MQQRNQQAPLHGQQLQQWMNVVPQQAQQQAPVPQQQVAQVQQPNVDVDMQQDDTNSVADSAFSLNLPQSQNQAPGFFGNILGGIFRRGQRQPPAPVPQQNVVVNSVRQNMRRHGNVPDVEPYSSGDLLRIAVAKALADLKPDKRHLLLDLLANEPSFQCLFAYVQGASAEASAQAAQRTRISPQHSSILAAHKATVQAAPMPDGPATAMEVDSHPSQAVAAAAATAAAAPVLAISCIPEFDAYAEGSAGGRVRVAVSLKATSEVKRQGQVALTSVLDVSGSMSGRRLELVKETSHFLVQQVTRGDFLGFITYSDTAAVDVPLTRMTPNAKLFAHTIVESMSANGSTALYDGTICGMQQQLDALADDARVAKAVLLCTDGEANVGPQTSDQILPGLHEQCRVAGQPCTVHTFGIGDGHCAELLQAIAESLSGSYYYIKNTADVAPAYGDALGGLLSVVAKNVRVTVRPGIAGAPIAVHAGGVLQGATVVYNDVYAEESRELLLTFNLPPMPRADGPGTSTAAAHSITQQLGEVQVEFVDPAADGAAACVVVPVTIVRNVEGATTPNPLVLTTAARYEAAEVIEKAQQLNKDGNVQGAAKLLNAYAEQLESMRGQAPVEVGPQLDMFSSQAKMVARAMEEAESNKHDYASVQMQSAVCKAASVGLRQQRAANVGVTSVLPQNAMYDNKVKAAVRKSAGTSVAASMAAKSAPTRPSPSVPHP